MRTMQSRLGIACLAAVFGLMVLVGQGHGEAYPASASIISVQATSANGQALFEEVFPVQAFNGKIGWGLNAPFVLRDQGVEIAQIDELSVEIDRKSVV